MYETISAQLDNHHWEYSLKTLLIIKPLIMVNRWTLLILGPKFEITWIEKPDSDAQTRQTIPLHHAPIPF